MPAHTTPDPEAQAAHQLHECPACGLFQPVPHLRPGLVAECVRCNTELRRRRRDSLAVNMALMVTGLSLFLIAASFPLLSLRATGITRDTFLPDLPIALDRFQMVGLSLVVFATTMAAPLLKLGLTAAVLIGLRRGSSPSTLAAMARYRAWLKPWSMVEVFLLGMFVAYTRLTAIATVDLGIALYALFALMLVMVTADAWLDEHAMWDAIGRLRRTRPPFGHGRLIGCQTCGFVSRAGEGARCPRCNEVLQRRKADPSLRCWALLLSGAALYLPANFLPVMTVIRLGKGQPSTIIGGVHELIEYKMWPLALLVFTASIMVPVVKLVLLVWLLVSTRLRSRTGLVLRTRTYAFVEAIGRWSMIDVFMIAILTALVRMGTLASVIPGPGATCFAAVVVLTMLAAMSFDPRVMWDRAEQPRPAPSPAPAPAPTPAAGAAA